MNEAWMEVGSSLLAVALASVFFLGTRWGRRALAWGLAHVPLPPASTGFALALGTAIGGVGVWVITGSLPPPWYRVMDLGILSLGVGVIVHRGLGTPPADRRDRAGP